MKPQNDPRTEEILNSLDGVSRATAPDFFYTRLQARMEKELLKNGRFEPKHPWILKPVFAVAMLVMILVINAAVIFQRNSEVSDPVATETDSYQSIASEYSLNDVVIEEVYK
jgi:hypothetical protein